ncbi:POU domain class 2-associating factor 1 [Lycodopsis pacificus]
MHWEKSSPAGLVRSRPYQGVRVRDPVKELLRRKRSLEPPAADVVTHNNQSSYTQGMFVCDAAEPLPPPAVTDGGLQQCAGWRAAPAGGCLQPGGTSWSSSEYNQQDAPAQTLAFPPTSALTADVYMQTLCPSYTMLTYTHTPLLTNFGTIPVGPAPGSIPQMELPDSGLTYLPWAQPITTISTMSNQVHFGPGSAALPGSPLLHMPLSMSLTTMIPQLEAPGADHPQILDLPQRPEHQMDPDLQDQSLDEDPVVDAEAPSLLDKLLEDQKAGGEEEDKDSYSSSLFISNA